MLDTTEKLRNKSEEEQKKRDMEAMQRNVQYFADLLKAAIDATNQVINLKIKEIDQQSSLQQKRVGDAKNIADRGNAEQLEMEQKRLDDLNKKRENSVRIAAAHCAEPVKVLFPPCSSLRFSLRSAQCLYCFVTSCILFQKFL